MGIINVTPDSFSDGGRYYTLEKALERAKELEKDGADIIDIGGESTGPNSKFVSLSEELKRVIPVLKKLRKLTKLPISIDTYKAEVARQALEEGADIVNDVTALRGDKKMAEVVAKYKVPVVFMYSKDNSPRTTVKEKHYKDVVKTISGFFEKRLAYAKKHGIKDSQIILDPGMGQFVSAVPKYSFEIIARLRRFLKFGRPILVGISRKSFLGGDIAGRDEKAKIINAIAYFNGAAILRVHDVKGLKEFFEN
jgi:dihydropteroate synthase